MISKTLCVVSSLALVAGLAVPALAQDTAAGEQPSAADTGEAATQADVAEQGRNTTIVVTAEFREENLQDTPIAITAVNAAMLEARGDVDVSDVAATAPNVTLKAQPQNGGSGLIAFIRGVGQTDFNFALDPGVGVYIDDVYIPTLSSSLLQLIDLDRVEILRGPQGTLAGKNSIGGAIKLFSAKPKGDGTGSFHLSYGSFNEIEARGMADVKLTDNVFMRVSGMARGRDGYVDIVDYAATHPDSNVPANNVRGSGNSGYQTQGGESIQAGRVALRFLPTDALEINIAADYTRERSESIPTVLIAAGKPISTTNPTFDPASVFAATDANGNAWLPGKDGTPVPLDCHFVPAGAYSCDNPAALSGFDARYVSYSNFIDQKVPTSQLPFKPYFALPITNFNGWGVQGNITYDLSKDIQLVYIGSYRAYVSKWGQDQDATPIPIAALDNQLNHHAWSSEVRLNFKAADDLLQGTVGGYYLDQNGRYTARVDLNYAGIDFLHGPDTTPSTTKALFGTLTINPSDIFSVTGGLRYTKDKKVYTYYRRNPDGTVPFQGALAPPPGAPPICESLYGGNPVFPGGFGPPTSIGNSPNCLLTGIFGISDGFEGDRWDWRVAANARVSEELLIYASVSTGFKGGGVNPRPFFGPSAGDCNAAGYVAPAPCNQLRPFDPETLTTYEVGFKSDLFDRRLRFNAAAFYNKYNDIILTLSACPSVPCLQPRNVGKADVKGAEAELTAFPVDGLELDGSVSYLNFKFDRASVAPAGLTGDETSPYTPEWTWSAGAQYNYDLSGGAQVSFRIDGTYQSSIYTDPFNTIWSKVDAYFLAHTRLAFSSADDAWTIAGEIDNLFDKYYYTSVSDATTSLGIESGVPGLPRTWKISVGRKF